MAEKKIYEWRDPGGASRWAVGVMVVNLIVHFGYLILAVIGPTADYAAGTVKNPAQAFHVGLVLLQGLMLFGAIAIVAWILRVSKNAHTFTKRSLEAPWMAALWWYVIPIATLFKPFMAMREIWDVSAPTWRSGQSLRWILNLWWPVSILGNGLEEGSDGREAQGIRRRWSGE